MAGADPSSVEHESIRWWLFGAVSFVGVALTGLAISTSVAWKWQGIWPSTFLDFGATILLGALLYVIQRSFVQVVRRESRETRIVVGDVEARAGVLERQVGQQSARIETLAEEIELGRRGRYAEEDSAVAAVTDEMTYDSVSRVLLEAERRRAISQSFRVRASGDVRGMRLYFKIVYAMDRSSGGTPFISLTTWFTDIRNTVRDSWQQGEDVSTVMNRIIVQMESANIDASTKTLDTELVFRNLRASLDLAFRSLRGELDRRLRGPLIEMVDDQWVLTDEGIESLVDDVFVPRGLFPNTIPQFQDPGTPPFAAPPAPDGISHVTWDALIEVARITFLLHGSSSIRP